jgi:hypothetical protein
MQEDHRHTAPTTQGHINSIEALHNEDPHTGFTLLNYMAAPSSSMKPFMQQVHTSPTYLPAIPTHLQGRRCNVDTSTAPDQPNQ